MALRGSLHMETSSLPILRSPPLPPSPLPQRNDHSVPIQTMSDDPLDQPWSNSPNAPPLSKYEYTEEKATLAGGFISSILYGTTAHTFIYSCSLPSFVYSRGTHHPILPMYGSAPQPPSSQRGGYQAVARILHHGHVLVCDRVHRSEPPHSIHFLHR